MQATMESENEAGMKEMLKILKREEPEPCTKTEMVMTDLARAFYNAWLAIMGPKAMHCNCLWHVDRAWEKNIKVDQLLLQLKELRVLTKEEEFEMTYCHLEKE